MLQYKIPQNIGIEDKIVGPFSLRQLMIVGAGVGISYTIFIISSRLYELNLPEYFVLSLPAIFALMIAMVKIHNVRFGKYILLTLEFAFKPKRRMWDHRGISALVAPDLRDKSAQQKPQSTAIVEPKKKINLDDLSSVLDSSGFSNSQKVQHEDIDKVEDDDLITEAYFGNKRDKSNTENMYWRTREMQKKKLDILAKMPKAAAKPAVQKTAEIPPAPTTTEATPTPAPVVVPALVAVPEPVIQTTSQAAARPRAKKPKIAQPVRQDTQINTIDKNSPNKVIQKNSSEEETTLGDLKQGGEIEFKI